MKNHPLIGKRVRLTTTARETILKNQSNGVFATISMMVDRVAEVLEVQESSLKTLAGSAQSTLLTVTVEGLNTIMANLSRDLVDVVDEDWLVIADSFGQARAFGPMTRERAYRLEAFLTARVPGIRAQSVQPQRVPPEFTNTETKGKEVPSDNRH